MPKEIGNRPVLFLAHSEYDALSRRYQGQDLIPDEDVFEPRTFLPEDWLRLLPRESKLIINLMMDPLNPDVLEDIWAAHGDLLEWETRVTDQLAMFTEEDPVSRALREREHDAIRIDGLPQQVLHTFARNLPHQPRPVFFRMRYSPDMNDFQAHVRLLMDSGSGPEGIVTRILEGGSFAFSSISSISGLDQAVGEQLGHPRMPTWLDDGARILVIPDSHNVLARPVIIPLRQREDGKLEFYLPRQPGARPEGAQAELVHSGALTERFHIKQIYKLIEKAVQTARDAGKRPMIVFDIDGTVANARAFTRRVFEEFLDAYQRLAAKKTGPLPATTWQIEGLPREIRGLAQGYLDFKRRESDTNEYDVISALSEFIEVYNSINNEAAQEIRAIYETYKQTHEPFPWNSVEMLESLKIHDPYVMALAAAHFELNFFNSVRRLDKEPIEGTIQLIRYLQHLYPDLATVSLTLRDAHDDNLPDGRSSSEVWFARHGIWNQNSVLLRLEERRFIDFSATAFQRGGNEPNKSDLLRRFLDAHPDLQPVAFLENDRKHTNEYLKLGYSTIVVRVDANDAPPHQPPDSNGILILSADQLKGAINATLEPDFIRALNQKAIDIAGKAWEPMMLRWHAAVAKGIQPVVILDIDDTLMMTSNRTRRILEKFLREDWLLTHPGHEWTLDVIEGFTLSQIEYGIPATIRNAGLDALGPEFESGFKDYFLRHFLSNEFLGEDLPRRGAVKFVRDLLAIGTHIVYLTGRTRDDMGEGTIESLRQAGFPIDEPGVELIMREDHAETDSAFKARVLRKAVGGGALVGFGDNESENIVRVLEISPGTTVYIVGDRHSPNAPDTPSEAIPIADFTGEIGPPPQRTRAMTGDDLRRQGTRAAEKLMHLLGRIGSDISFNQTDGGMDYGNRIEANILELVRDALPLLDEFEALHPLHPKSVAFITKLNELVLNFRDGMSSFNNLLAEVNSRANRSFTTLPGPSGISQIIEANRNTPARASRGSARRSSERHRTGRPAGLRSTRLPHRLPRFLRARTGVARA